MILYKSVSEYTIVVFFRSVHVNYNRVSIPTKKEINLPSPLELPFTTKYFASSQFS